MTYYEELGVPVTASADEIHQAYRQLARLLHPDPQADAELRRAAERQMRRLNEIHSLLSDRASRAKYDASLCERPARGRSSGLWIALAAAVVAIVWAAGVNWPSPVEPPSAVRPALKDPPIHANAAPVRRRRPAASPALREKSLSEEIRHPRQERDLEAPPSRDVESVAAGPHGAPEPTRSPPPESPPPRAPALAPTLSGTWFYANDASTDARLPYPPEYIEAVIVERGGSIRGRYRARYRVRDRAISPTVAFAFEGVPDAPLPWRGPAGARGEVHLRLVAGSLLEVSWSAQDLGSEMGLAAGRAVLTRVR